jgi:hypothetical protein
MKSIGLIVISLFLVTMASAQVQKDIVLKSRFDLTSSEAFIGQLRIFLANNNFGDPYSQETKKPITIDLRNALDEMPEDTQNWIKALQSVLQIGFFDSDYKVILERFRYVIKDFNSELKPGSSNLQRVDYVTVNYVNGLTLKADKISFEIDLKQTGTREPITFKIELVEPTFIVSHELMAEISMGWATSIIPGNILLTLESVDIGKVMQRVVKKPELIELQIKDMIMPDIAVRVGNKSVKLDQSKIRNFFMTRKDDMKRGLLDILNTKLGDKFSNIIKDSPKNLLLPRTYAFENEINGVLDIQKMDVNNTGIVQFDFDGHFCETSNSMQDNFCRNSRVEAKVRRKIDYSHYQKSLREMNRSLIERKTNISLSISEAYLNQLIEATILSGLWERSLKGKDFRLGPEKAFVLADKKGELFSLYLDIIYKLKPAQRILVGRSELRFPIKFMIALNIKEIDNVPHLTIKVKDVATDHMLLLEGAPEYDLPTTVTNLPRFRTKVLKAIMKDVTSFKGQTLVDIEMKELVGTYLDQLEFFSDGLGRGTATLGF